MVEVLRLTPTQEGMMYHSLAESESDIFHSQVSHTLPSTLNVSRFKKAWEHLVARHDALRTTFFWDGLDEPLQVVRPEATVAWVETDWSGLSDAEYRQRLAELFTRDAFEPFSFDTAPLIRMRLVRTPDGDWTWIWTFHHLILDGWSVRVLMRELAEIYGGNGDTLRDPVPPARYSEWRATLDPTPSMAFWAEQLIGLTEPQRLELPGFDSAEPGKGHGRLDLEIPPDLVQSLRGTASSLGVSTSAMITAAWSLVVSAMTSARDVAVGVTTSGRPPQLDGVEEMVGMFLNTLPLRVSTGDADTLGQFITAVHAAQLDLLSHQQTALTELHRLAGLRGGESIFESIIVYENLPPEDTADDSLGLAQIDFRERSNYALALLVRPEEQFILRLVFDQARFPTAAARTLLDTTKTVIEQLTEPDTPMTDLRLSGSAASAMTGPVTSPITRTIVDEILLTAKATPDAVAVSCGSEELTYRELWRRVEDLARQLVDSGVDPGDPVGVLLPRSAAMVVGVLGVLRSGAAYVPLDPSYPSSHLESVMTEASLSHVITGRDVSKPPADKVIVFIEDAQAADSPLPPLPGLDDLAYIIHTSGSTGLPKGVMVSHRNLASSTKSRTAYYSDPVGTFLLLSSFAFDSSVAGIFWTLSTGGCLVIPEHDRGTDPAHFRHLIADRQVTHLLALPALYRLLADEPGAMPPSLRIAIVAGEAIDSAVVSSHFTKSPARLFNEYGPSEGTVWATVAELNPSVDIRTIGKPIPGATVRIVTPAGQQVPPGFAGELEISGPGVAQGYSNDPAATEASFVEHDGTRWYRTGDRAAHSPEGEILYLGRTDAQVKIRGHRIEPTGVAAVITDLPLVTDAYVTSAAIHGNQSLVAYVEGSTRSRQGSSESRKSTAPPPDPCVHRGRPRVAPAAQRESGCRIAIDTDFKAHRPKERPLDRNRKGPGHHLGRPARHRRSGSRRGLLRVGR